MAITGLTVRLEGLHGTRAPAFPAGAALIARAAPRWPFREAPGFQALGFAYTDATGYFKLSAAVGGAKSKTAASEPTAAGSTGPVYAYVLDARSTTLAADSRALNPTAGRVDYEEIVLGLAKPPGGTPPDGAKRNPPGPTRQ